MEHSGYKNILSTDLRAALPAGAGPSPTLPPASPWCCCVCTKALVAQQLRAVRLRLVLLLVLLLPQPELLAGNTLMLRSPLQTQRRRVRVGVSVSPAGLCGTHR